MKIFNRTWLVVLLVLLGFGVLHTLTSSDFARLTDIRIQGASPETESRLRGRLESKVGTSFWRIPVEREAENIKKDPWVESVEVRKRFPNSLLVSIVERKPFAVVGNGDGQFRFVDESNFLLGYAEANQIHDYTVLMGRNFQDKAALRAQAVEVLKALPREGVLSSVDVSDLQYTEEHGFQLTLSKTGMVVDLGKDNIPLHLDRARRVVQYLESHGIDAMHVDSGYGKKVLVKVRKGR